MSIQANVNQLISLAGLLASQTPWAAKQREKAAGKEIEAREARIRRAAAEEEAGRIAAQAEEQERKFGAAVKHAEEGIPAEKTAAGKEAELEVYGDIAQLAKQRYLTNPTAETYQDYVDYATGYKESAENYETEKASARAKREKAEAKAKIATEEEARRIAISRSITEGISYSPESEKYLEKRNKGGTY